MLRRRYLALILAAAIGSCDITLTSQMYWENGQVTCVRGEQDSNSNRHGVWVYFDEEGSVMPSTVVIDGATCWRTGYYEHGQWMRLPDAVELAAAEARAKELTEACRAARR